MTLKYIPGVKVYDNLGITFDRYTVITPDMVYVMSEFPLSQHCVNMCFCDPSELIFDEVNTGILLTWDNVPEEVQQAIYQRVNNKDWYVSE